MPYTLANLPDNIKKLSDKEQRQWMNIWNSAYARCMKGKGADKDKCETSAFAQANGVVLKSKHSATAFAGFTESFKGWDTETLESLPDSAFFYIEPGGKKDSEGKTTPRSKRHLPYKDASGRLDIPHLHYAIAGFSRGASLPGLSSDARDSLEKKAQEMLDNVNAGKDARYTGSMVSFALSDEPTTPLFEDDGIVYRPGLVFRAGDYPDKAYSMTPDEIAAAVEMFDGAIPIDLEHVPTLLDGQLGELVSVSCSEDNQELHGIVALPKWLDDMLPDRKVSAMWDRQTKTLSGLSLVRNPRVEDAALMAAFAEFKRHDTYEGQRVLQQIHDDAARKGAICDPPDGKAKMHSSHEGDAIQKVHDITTEHGAQCAAMQDRNNVVSPYYFSDGNKTKKESKRVPDNEGRMAQFLAWLKGEGSDDPTTAFKADPPVGTPAQAAPSAVAVTTTGNAEFDAMQRRNAQLEADLERERLSRIQDAAFAYADGLVKDSIIMPSERQAKVYEYEQAAKDDMILGPAKFNVDVTGPDGKPVSTEVVKPRLDAMKERDSLRPKHVLTTEMLGTRLTQVLMNAGETPRPGEERVDDRELKRLIALSATGRAIASQNGTTK